MGAERWHAGFCLASARPAGHGGRGHFVSSEVGRWRYREGARDCVAWGFNPLAVLCKFLAKGFSPDAIAASADPGCLADGKARNGFLERLGKWQTGAAEFRRSSG